MSKAKAAKAAKTPYVFPKLYHVEYIIRGPEADDVTHFTGPDPTRLGSASILAENDLQLGAVLKRFFGHGPGETVEVKSTRVLSEGVLTVVGGYDKQSTGIEPPKHAKKAAKKAKKPAAAKKPPAEKKAKAA
jgi:hypothetical protein